MSEDYLLETYRQLRTSQDKYVYFMLAAAASAIAYALNRAQDRILTLPLLPWGISILFWGLSFYFGCKHIAYVNSTIYANVALLKVQNGSDPEIGSHPQYIAAASEGIKMAIEGNVKKANHLGKSQFVFFIIGVLAYIIWQILEMYIRSQIS
jgi:hypothetical protein